MMDDYDENRSEDRPNYQANVFNSGIRSQSLIRDAWGKELRYYKDNCQTNKVQSQELVPFIMPNSNPSALTQNVRHKDIEKQAKLLEEGYALNSSDPKDQNLQLFNNYDNAASKRETYHKYLDSRGSTIGPLANNANSLGNYIQGFVHPAINHLRMLFARQHFDLASTVESLNFQHQNVSALASYVDNTFREVRTYVDNAKYDTSLLNSQYTNLFNSLDSTINKMLESYISKDKLQAKFDYLDDTISRDEKCRDKVLAQMEEIWKRFFRFSKEISNLKSVIESQKQEIKTLTDLPPSKGSVLPLNFEKSISDKIQIIYNGLLETNAVLDNDNESITQLKKDTLKNGEYIKYLEDRVSSLEARENEYVKAENLASIIDQMMDRISQLELDRKEKPSSPSLKNFLTSNYFQPEPIRTSRRPSLCSSPVNNDVQSIKGGHKNKIYQENLIPNRYLSPVRKFTPDLNIKPESSQYRYEGSAYEDTVETNENSKLREATVNAVNILPSNVPRSSDRKMKSPDSFKPDYLPKFDKKENLFTFFKAFERVTAPASDERKVHILLSLLDNKTIDLVYSKLSGNWSYNDAKKVIMKQYSSPIQLCQKRLDFMRFTGRKDERLTSFIERFSREADALVAADLIGDIDVKLALRHAIEQNRELDNMMMPVISCDNNSSEYVLTYMHNVARNFPFILSKSRDKNSSSPKFNKSHNGGEKYSKKDSDSSPKFDISKVTCVKCGKKGHYANVCTSKTPKVHVIQESTSEESGKDKAGQMKD